MLKSNEQMVYAKLMLSNDNFSRLERSRTDAEWAYIYAFWVLKRRWPEAEATIAKNSNAAYCYAVNVIRGRFLKGEREIFAHEIFSYNYKRDILHEETK